MISATEVKQLRDMTGSPMMECKKALSESDGDFKRAVEYLRARGADKVSKRSDRQTSEGVIVSYIHPPGKIGVLVEVHCETDFVARNDETREFAYQVAMHVASTDPSYLDQSDIPEAAIADERRVALEKAKKLNKPPQVAEKIVDGQLNKWKQEVALLSQAHINHDKYSSKTIKELQDELGTKMGEKIRLARFIRFAI
jgi:elongation factor Ts